MFKKKGHQYSVNNSSQYHNKLSFLSPVAGCHIQDPQVSGWLLDPTNPSSCYRDLLNKHSRRPHTTSVGTRQVQWKDSLVPFPCRTAQCLDFLDTLNNHHPINRRWLEFTLRNLFMQGPVSWYLDCFFFPSLHFIEYVPLLFLIISGFSGHLRSLFALLA